jgi:hypothetical protein
MVGAPFMSIVVKGSKVVFIMTDGREIRLPRGYGIIHDPEGKALPRCEVFFGPVKKTKRIAANPSSKVRRYFGSKYTPKEGVVDVPSGPWHSVGDANEILYERTKGSQYAGNYFHPFKRFPPTVSKCGRYYRVSLKDGCIVDDRGFVFP